MRENIPGEKSRAGMFVNQLTLQLLYRKKIHTTALQRTCNSGRAPKASTGRVASEHNALGSAFLPPPLSRGAHRKRTKPFPAAAHHSAAAAGIPFCTNITAFA